MKVYILYANGMAEPRAFSTRSAAEDNYSSYYDQWEELEVADDAKFIVYAFGPMGSDEWGSGREKAFFETVEEANTWLHQWHGAEHRDCRRFRVRIQKTGLEGAEMANTTNAREYGTPEHYLVSVMDTMYGEMSARLEDLNTLRNEAMNLLSHEEMSVTEWSDYVLGELKEITEWEDPFENAKNWHAEEAEDSGISV